MKFTSFFNCLIVATLTTPPTTVSAEGNFKEFRFVARHYFPAGYKEGTTTESEPDLYGYGFGALERTYYDATNRIFYGGSEIGFVTITDFGNYPHNMTVLPFGIPLTDGLTDVKVCNDLLFISTKNDPNPGHVHVYTAVKHKDDTSNDELVPPTLIQSIEVGYGPDNILLNHECTILATANEGEGKYTDQEGLINPPGSVSIVRGPFDEPDTTPPTVTSVSLNKWTDQELMDAGVHLPLSLNAMKYWNGTGINFQAAMDSYTTDMILEPEYLAWNNDETKIYCNLQENSAMIVIDVETNMAESIHAYGVKDWSEIPIDIVQDGECILQPQEGLYSIRSADAIASFVEQGVNYIITANEGDDLEYGLYEEKLKGKDIFQGTDIALEGMTADPSIFNENGEGLSRFFNSECDATAEDTPFCSSSMRFSIGSSMVDYETDPMAPNIYRLTAIGGRGITIYKVTEETNDNSLEMVWDSGQDFEKEGCKAYPWAHNAIQDEEFSPVGGPFYNSLEPEDELRTIIDEFNDPGIDGCTDGGDGTAGACPMGQVTDDRCLKDGPGPETIVVGNACDTLFAVTVAEKSSIGYIYDLTDVIQPTLVHVFHLSVESENYNPGLAYNQRILGEIDSETIQFVTTDQSPTGNAGVFFSGAFSGTTSFWEFICKTNKEDDNNDTPVEPPSAEAPAETPAEETPAETPAEAPAETPTEDDSSAFDHRHYSRILLGMMMIWALVAL